MSVFEHGYALVVGVAGYNDRALPALPLAVLNDAVDFACTLWNPEIGGYRADRVRLLLDEQATAHGFLRGLEWLIESCTEKDTAVIFFSGHAWHSSGGSYLAAHDAQIEPREGLIPSDALTSYIRAIPAGRLVVFLDCCYSGSIGDIHGKGSVGGSDLKTGLDEQSYSMLATGEGRALLASSQPGSKSIVLENTRNSIFTACLLQAMSGAAGNLRMETIGVIDIFQAVASAVKERSLGLQKPLFKAAVSENFPVVLRCRNPIRKSERHRIEEQGDSNSNSDESSLNINKNRNINENHNSNTGDQRGR